jgi:hypothetical protein
VRIFVVMLVLAAVVAAALPIDDRRAAPAEPRHAAATPAPTPADTPDRRDVRKARCDDGVPDCRAIRGTVIYVERVDPDGDGDLHVVLNAGSITLPGMTAVDVAPELRPRRDPRIGDRASAAGPVEKGSYGQSQIHALEFHVTHG